MPRRSRPREAGVPPDRGLGWTRTEIAADGEWVVRSVPGNRSDRTYRCPGCDHEIRPGSPQLVCWPATGYGSVDDRRHWHTGCWSARARRRPG